MSKKSDKPKILLDCDVIIHFIKAGQQLVLPKIFPGRFVILDKVKTELEKRKSTLIQIENFIAWSKIAVVPMPTDTHVIKEYISLKKTVGEGEAACMAVARHNNEYIASSNLKDIKTYCDRHNIVYLTTMDILLEAYRLDLINETDCDQFIKEVKSKNSKLIHNIDSIRAYDELKKNEKR